MACSADPYRESPSSSPPQPLPRCYLGRVLGALGLWRYRWVRKLLGGRWEKFVFITHVGPDDEVTLIPNRSTVVRCGEWHRVFEFSSIDLADNSVGTLRVMESIRGIPIQIGPARVSYHRENWS